MFFALLITSVLSSTQAYNTNLSYSVLSECKEYQIDGQYKYRDAFTILDMKNNKPFENEIFRLKLYVFTKQDAHILISNEPRVHKGESAYEIVFGGYDNTESCIKVHRLGPQVVRKKGEVTSPLYPTEIIIALREDGELSVILPDFERPYMVYKDKSARYWTYLLFPLGIIMLHVGFMIVHWGMMGHRINVYVLLPKV
uniref:Farnesoic acid O-methyl transferase domain-containing protein n=1 Tax=Megaselia scalaris TaxID=36166 RepID=T1GCQ2_MEGSC